MAQVAAGLDSTCAVDSEGTVSCWGLDDRGQLGRGLLTGVASIPANIDDGVLGDQPSAVRAVTVGDRFACAVTMTGEVWCWGANDRAQLGGGVGEDASSPSQIAALSGITRLSAGASHACAVDGDSHASCWGDNGTQQSAGAADDVIAAPTLVVDEQGHALAVLDVAAGAAHTCGRATDAVSCWGDNASGEIGDGTSGPARWPTEPICP